MPMEMNYLLAIIGPMIWIVGALADNQTIKGLGILLGFLALGYAVPAAMVSLLSS